MTQIIGFSGKLQAGKDTLTNWLHAAALVNDLKIVGGAYVNELGQLMVPVDEKGNFDVFNLDSRNPQVVEWLSVNVWPHIKSFSCAEPLKDFCINYLGVTEESMWGSNEEKSKPTHLKWASMPGYKGKHGDEYMTGREVMEYWGTEVFRKIEPDIWAKKLLEYIAISNTRLAVVKDVRFPNEVKAIQSCGGKVIRLTRTTKEAAENKHISNTALDDYDGFDYVLDNQDLDIDQTVQKLHEYLLAEFPPPPAPPANRYPHVI